MFETAFVADEVVDASASISSNKTGVPIFIYWMWSFPRFKTKGWSFYCVLQQAYFYRDVLVELPGQPFGLHTTLAWMLYGKNGGDQQLIYPLKLMVKLYYCKKSNPYFGNHVIEILKQEFKDCDAADSPKLFQDDKRAL